MESEMESEDCEVLLPMPRFVKPLAPLARLDSSEPWPTNSRIIALVARGSETSSEPTSFEHFARGFQEGLLEITNSGKYDEHWARGFLDGLREIDKSFKYSESSFVTESHGVAELPETSIHAAHARYIPEVRLPDRGSHDLALPPFNGFADGYADGLRDDFHDVVIDAFAEARLAIPPGRDANYSTISSARIPEWQLIDANDGSAWESDLHPTHVQDVVATSDADNECASPRQQDNMSGLVREGRGWLDQLAPSEIVDANYPQSQPQCSEGSCKGNGVCWKFSDKGNCDLGADCRFCHDMHHVKHRRCNKLTRQAKRKEEYERAMARKKKGRNATRRFPQELNRENVLAKRTMELEL